MPVHDLHLEDLVDHDDFVYRQIQREKRKCNLVFYGPEKPDCMTSKKPSPPPSWRVKDKVCAYDPPCSGA